MSKFKYGQRVKIKSDNFYDGAVGTLVEYAPWRSDTNAHTGEVTWQEAYKVDLGNTVALITEEQLVLEEV